MSHRHTYTLPPTPAEMEAGDWLRHCPCGRREHPEATQKARSSVRLGKDQERRIERVYGPEKVGERGDAVDLIGRDFKWQSKATRGVVPRYLVHLDRRDGIEPYWWARAPIESMAVLRPELSPLLIRSFVHVGMPVKDYVVVRSRDWSALHGYPVPASYLMVMTGAYFLAVHGRDEKEE